jgi:hypothetical protein
VLVSLENSDSPASFGLTGLTAMVISALFGYGVPGIYDSPSGKDDLGEDYGLFRFYLRNERQVFPDGVGRSLIPIGVFLGC